MSATKSRLRESEMFGENYLTTTQHSVALFETSHQLMMFHSKAYRFPANEEMSDLTVRGYLAACLRGAAAALTHEGILC